jgi:hypothetical protein
VTPEPVAALYVDTRGAYAALPGVDPWDAARDARLYAGPHPVVAHPPCHLWVNLTCVNFKRYGGEHNRPGNDGGCFRAALASVRQWGGVLEHPAFSRAWAAFGLTRPTRLGWNPAAPEPGWPGDKAGWVCEVWQSAYGHKARKRTWLYAVLPGIPLELRWERTPGTHQVGWFDRNKRTLGKKEASATPTAFRDELLRLARHSR